MSSQSTELANKSSISVTDTDASFVKIIILLALTTLVAFAVGYFIVSPHAVLSPLFIGIYLVLFIFQTLFIKSWSKIFPAVLAQSIVILIPVILDIRQIHPYLFIAWLIFLFSAASMEFSGIQKIKNSIRIPFWRVSRMVFTKIFATIAIFATIIYLIPAPEGSKMASASDEAQEIAVVRPMRYFFPEFSSTTTVSQLSIMLAERAVNKQDFAENLSASDKNKLVQETAAAYISATEDKIGTIESNLTVGSAIMKKITDFMQGLSIFKFFLANFAIFFSLWLLFRGIASILYLPLSVIIFLIYETLIVTNFVSIQYEARSREIAILK